MSSIAQLNNGFSLGDFQSVRELKVNKKYLIKCFSVTDTPYGEKIKVKLENCSTILPHRFTERFTPEFIEKLNQEIKSGKKYNLVSKGPLGRSTNIEFLE
jgi:tRNA G10  N-methylase Trm11